MSRPCSCNCHSDRYECGPCGTLHGMVEGMRRVLEAMIADSMLAVERYPSVAEWTKGRASAYQHTLDVLNAWSSIGGVRPEPEPQAPPETCGATRTQADPLFPEDAVTYTCNLAPHTTGNHQDSLTEAPSYVIWAPETTGRIVPADPQVAPVV